jgi:mono/diheme cytochrome c family protein
MAYSSWRRFFWRFALLSAVLVGAASCAYEPNSQAEKDDEIAVVRGLAGSPARGRAYAQLACADCHAVAPDDTQSPNPAAPPFQSVANWPGMTPTALSAWLHTPHPTMPDLIIEPNRIDDLSAYLYTLKELD